MLAVLQPEAIWVALGDTTAVDVPRGRSVGEALCAVAVMVAAVVAVAVMVVAVMAAAGVPMVRAPSVPVVAVGMAVAAVPVVRDGCALAVVTGATPGEGRAKDGELVALVTIMGTAGAALAVPGRRPGATAGSGSSSGTR